MGDDWTHEDYRYSESRAYGESVIVEGSIDEIPWMYAREVDVALHAEYEDKVFERSFKGYVQDPDETEFTVGEPLVHEVRVAEYPYSQRLL